jgi:REP element-mobilizing transposase RayT
VRLAIGVPSVQHLVYEIVKRHSTRQTLVSQSHVHLVFLTRYRKKIFDADALRRLRVYFEKVCTDFEAQLVAMNGEVDHVHLLINAEALHLVVGQQFEGCF